MASHGSQAISRKSPVGIKGRLGNYETGTGIKPSWRRKRKGWHWKSNQLTMIIAQ
jgi:hypothetical protein